MQRTYQFYGALWLAKLARRVLLLAGREASNLPGKIALKLCPDFLSLIGRPEIVACVTGTNGKTTTCNLVVDALRHSGVSVTCNVYGSNINTGIAAALLADSSLLGNAKNKLAVLEVDERSSLLIYPRIRPDYVLCTGLFRDSIRRNANTDFISYIISKALPEQTHLILNGDDLICSGIGPQCAGRTYYGVNSPYGVPEAGRGFLEKLYCPRCGAPMEYGLARYSHVGRVYCSNCGFKSPTCDYVITEVDPETSRMTLEQGGKRHTLRLVNDNIVNVYNVCGACTLLDKLGLAFEQITAYLEEAKIVDSRFSSEQYGDAVIVRQLAKGMNPIACSSAINYVCHTGERKKNVILSLDDIHENSGNVENTCWIYETDFSPLLDDSVSRVILAGPRNQDFLVRALLEGVDRDRIFCTEDFLNAADFIETEGVDYCILYDLYIADKVDALTDRIKAKLAPVNTPAPLSPRETAGEPDGAADPDVPENTTQADLAEDTEADHDH